MMMKHDAVNSSHCLTLGTDVTYCYSTHCTITIICNYYCSNIFYLYILYTAFVYIFLFFFNVCVFCILYSSLWMLILALSNEPLLWIVSLHYK